MSALSRWVRAERGSSNTAPVQKKVFNLLEQDELTRLRKEVTQLHMRYFLASTSDNRMNTRIALQS
jgi:hypothetical protein